MAAPPLSGACHDRWTVELTRLPVGPGASAILGSTGSLAANIRMPPDCRVMVALAANEFGGPPTPPPVQPSSQPAPTRPSVSAHASHKASLLRRSPPV